MASDRLTRAAERDIIHLFAHTDENSDLIGIGRVLHDAMEIERHLPRAFGDE